MNIASAILLVLAFALLLAGITMFTWVTQLVLPSIFRTSPYVPAKPEAITRLLGLLEPRKGELLIDVGSGDGCILLAAAKLGCRVKGSDLLPYLVWWSRWRLSRAGFSDVSEVRRGSFWEDDWSMADCVTVYALGPLMPRIEEKMQRELKPGARVVCLRSPLPTWAPVKQDGNAWLYVR